MNTKLTKSLLRTTDNYIKALEKGGVSTVADFLNQYPRDYEDRTNVLDTFSLLNIKEKNTILVKLLSLNSQKTGGGKLLTKAVIEDKNGFLSEAVWFNRKYLATTLKPHEGKKILVTGKVKYAFGKVTFQSPEVETDLSKVAGEIVPVYSDINYIPTKWTSGKIEFLKNYITDISEDLPNSIIEKYNFISKKEAVYKIHFPRNKNDIALAKDRLAYGELFEINYKAISGKYETFKNTEGRARAIKMNAELVKEILSNLPFELTDHQKIVLFQVLKDMEKSHSMQRLLEGDVGTGKTAVALVAAIHGVVESRENFNLNIDQPHLNLNTNQPHPNLNTNQPHPNLNTNQPHPNPLLRGEGISYIGEKNSNCSLPLLEEREFKGEVNLEFKGEVNSEKEIVGVRQNYKETPKYIKTLSQKLRQTQTKAEELLWEILRNKQINGIKFRRQHPFGRYIADFYSDELKLVIELDGEIHEKTKEYDELRDEIIKKYGVNILRINNSELNDIENVIQKILSPSLGNYLKIDKGIQVAIMAPTEILARQHFASMQELLMKYNLSSHLLVGSLTKKQKEAVKADIKYGNVDVVIGTHALVQEGVFFNNLGFVVVDEQHRFGVKQREVLEKGFGNRTGIVPHSLNMTATPIPRTLALTLYGDQDLSIISQYPKGRKEIHIKVAKTENQRMEIERFVRAEVEKGRQIFWISPLVEESEKMDLANAISTYENLIDIFHPHRVGLLHGKMKAKEKDAIMKEFSENKIQILSSTSVVEVGVDVPNATIMCIEGAERFGLSQLHQFRGRVGRGQHQSYCYLFPTKGNYTDRLKAMERTNNGFELAEIDLELRGPGEVYGLRQSGVPDLKVADLRDLELVSQIREDIEELFEKKEK